MTVATAIRTALTNHGPLTDRQIAEYAGFPAPSVRRTRSRMEDQNIIEAVVDADGNTDTPIRWRVAGLDRN